MMRVLLRADSGLTQGTGHVMRCLTLGETLLRRGHSVTLATRAITVDWLASVVANSGVSLWECEQDELDLAAITDFNADWNIVDSYRIDPAKISELSHELRVLAIVDGDLRDISATLYLDQNLGAELQPHGAVPAERMLAGSRYALVRQDVLDQRRADPWDFGSRTPHIVSFMGGTDPTGASVQVSAGLSLLTEKCSITIVAPEHLHETIVSASSNLPFIKVMAPTPLLPAVLGSADLVISASGTSAWDICSLGVPPILVAVVANQTESLRQAVQRGLALGIDLTADAVDLSALALQQTTTLLRDSAARQQLSVRGLSLFDGLGAERVAQAMEAHLAHKTQEF